MKSPYAGATSTGAVMFDPASFFGHSEFDLALTQVNGITFTLMVKY